MATAFLDPHFFKQLQLVLIHFAVDGGLTGRFGNNLRQLSRRQYFQVFGAVVLLQNFGWVLLRTVVGVVGVAKGDVSFGGSFGEADELDGCLFGFAEHLGLGVLVLGVEERDDVLGGLAGLELGGEVEHVAFVLVVGRQLLEEARRLQLLLAGLL